MEYHHILRHVYWVIMKNEKVMKLLHCFEIMLEMGFGLPQYFPHTTHYTTIWLMTLMDYYVC